MSFVRPSGVLRRTCVRLDNLAIVPANLLPFKEQWQAVANGLPEGTTLIILPAASTPSRKILDKVVALLQARGQKVTILAAEYFVQRGIAAL